jgi:uncharacterized protein (DUF1810 family)
MDADPYNLQRFLDAQQRDYESALAELRAGRKRTHWIWYILPQFAGLGTSHMSSFYGIRSSAEAAAYLAHPILGPRLRECVAVLNSHQGLSAEQILGDIDAMKFKSSATLFAALEGPESVFGQALARFFSGDRDERTRELLAAESGTR